MSNFSNNARRYFYNIYIVHKYIAVVDSRIF